MGKKQKSKLGLVVWLLVVWLLVAVAGLLLFLLMSVLFNDSMLANGGNGILEGFLLPESPPQQGLLTLTQEADPVYLDETVFVGDSNTVRLYKLGLLPQAQCMGQVSMGIQAVRDLACVYLDGAAYTIPQALAKVQPRRVVITFGTNDIGVGSTPQEFIRQYRLAIAAIQQAYPQCEIIVNSIPPAAKRNDYPQITRQALQEYNDALLQMCLEDGLPYLNSFEDLADSEGFAKPQYTIEDGIHLSREGLAVMLHYYATHTLAAPQKSIPPSSLSSIQPPSQRERAYYHKPEEWRMQSPIAAAEL